MRRMVIIGILSALVAGGGALVATQVAQGQVAINLEAPFTYSAKFVCGEFDKFSNPNEPAIVEGPVKPGNYQTAINVHNPNMPSVTFRKKAILMFAGDRPVQFTEFEVPKPPGQLRSASLQPDWGMEIDCQDIRQVLLAGQAPPAPTFIKGWVVLLSPLPLDVEAVYSGHGFNPDPTTGGIAREGFSLDIERVAPTQL